MTGPPFFIYCMYPAGPLKCTHRPATLVCLICGLTANIQLLVHCNAFGQMPDL